jgi:ribonuclease HI
MSETYFNPDFHVTIHLAVACKGNPGPGGWGCVLRKARRVLKLYDSASHTTSKSMELLAAIGALGKLTSPSTVVVTTCSEYLVKGVNEWMADWVTRGWTKRDGTPVSNRQLWQQLEVLCRSHRVRWEWVPAKLRCTDGQSAWETAHQAALKAGGC